MTHHTSFPPVADVTEFEDTRPALYFATDRWSHLPDGRRRDRRAANDPVRPTPETPAPPRERRAGWGPL